MSRKASRGVSKSINDTDPNGGETESESMLRLVEMLLKRAKADLIKKGNLSTSDLIRLMQFRRELEHEAPREVEVKWVLPRENEESPVK